MMHLMQTKKTFKLVMMMLDSYDLDDDNINDGDYK